MLDRIRSPLGIGCLAYGVVAVVVLVVVLPAFGPGKGGGLVKRLRPRPILCLPAALWLGGALPGIAILSRKRYLAWFSSIAGGLGCVALLFLGGTWLATGPFFWIIALLLPQRMECPSCTRVISNRATTCPYCSSEVKSVESGQVVEAD